MDDLDLSLSLDDFPLPSSALQLVDTPQSESDATLSHSPPTIPVIPVSGGHGKRKRCARDSWSDAEHELLEALVQTHGFRWRLLASLMPGRSEDATRQAWCRRHGTHHKKRTGTCGPVGKRPHWTEEEDAALIEGLARFGKGQWRTIAKEYNLDHSNSAIKGRAYRLLLINE